MKEFMLQTKWQFILLARNNIISLSVIVTLIYIGLFFGIRHLGNMEKLVTLIILNDPAIIGLFFIGISILLEKNQQVLSALFVTPINHHTYLVSRVLVLSLVGWFCALGMGLAALGTDFNLLHFSFGVFGICILSCLAGIYLVCFSSEFMKFILKTIPVLLLFINLPMLNYFGVTDVWWFRLLPAQGSLDLIINSYRETPVTQEILLGYLSILFWGGLLYALVYRTFQAKIVNT